MLRTCLTGSTNIKVREVPYYYGSLRTTVSTLFCLSVCHSCGGACTGHLGLGTYFVHSTCDIMKNISAARVTYCVLMKYSGIWYHCNMQNIGMCHYARTILHQHESREYPSCKLLAYILYSGRIIYNPKYYSELIHIDHSNTAATSII